MKQAGDFAHCWQRNGRTITFTWVEDINVPVARVYALAFTVEGKILLVGGGPGDPGYWLPGGGIEAGEAPEGALARELREEAAATIFDLKQLGAQRVDDSLGTTEYHAFFWCRVALSDEYAPRHEVSKRKLVEPADFLDTLFWGRDDPKASVLLKRALQFDRLYSG